MNLMLPHLIEFWTNCRERRKEQLILHEHSYTCIVNESHGNPKLTPLLKVQTAFMHEASRKLSHADAMLRFLKGLK